MRSERHDGGAYSRTAFAAINKTAVAASTGDATEVDGAWADRAAPSEGGFAHSAKLVITYTTTLQDAETLTFAVTIQDADADSSGAVDSGTAEDYGSGVAATVVATGDGSPAETITGTMEIDVDLAGARRFVRAQVTPNLSASGTDTAEWSANYVLYGASRQPMSQAVAKVGGPA